MLIDATIVQKVHDCKVTKILLDTETGKHMYQCEWTGANGEPHQQILPADRVVLRNQGGTNAG